MEEYLIAMSRRSMGNRNYWIMVVANAYKAIPDTTLNKTKFVIEGESPFTVMLKWPNDFTWRIFVMFSIYLSVIVTVLMPIELFSVVVLVIFQHVCTVFFFMDFILAILHRILNLPAKITARRRKYECLIIESASLIPLSTFYIITEKDHDRSTIFWLSSIVLLRLYRIPQFFFEEAKVAGTLHITMKLLEYLLYLFLSLLIFSVTYLTIFAENRDLEIKDWNATTTNKFFVAMYFSVVTLTNTGFGDIVGTTSCEMIICSLGMLTGYALTNGVLVGSLTTDIVNREKPREKYRIEYEAIIKKFRRKNLSKSLQSKLLRELEVLWKYKRGVSCVYTLDLIPIPLRKEILFDIAFGFLSRSLIFSIQDRSFLRSISLAMKNKTFLPGDIILHSKRISRGMLCLAVGVIEILSREDDDTAIISFTSGTILGEVSLFMPMPVTAIIRAATFVELQVLDTVDFYRLALKYPSNYASMREDILRRYSESRKIDINSVTESLDPEEDYHPRLKSLKFLIENLKKDVQEQEAGFSSLTFKQNILNLYVLIENLPRVKTLPINLIRNSPWILRPDTTLTKVWNKFMFVTVTVVIFSYPYLAAFVRKIDNTVFALLLIIQLIYMADLFLQCITAIPRDDLISYNTSIKEIVLTRLKSYGFYLDVLSTYEFGVFTPLFQSETEGYMRLILSQNKLLRIWIIPLFFKRVEDDLSTNLLLFRIFKYIYYTTWFIHFSSAILYLEACPLSECHPDRWFSNQQAKEVGESEVREPFTQYPYILSLFFGLMCASGTGYGNIIPSAMADVFTILVLVILGLLIFHYCLAELSATFKHFDRKKTEFQEDLFAIDRFLIEHQIPQNLRRRVKRYFVVQWEYDQGTSFKRDIPLDELPKKQRENMLTDSLLTLQAIPIFQNANRGFMEVLAKGCKIRILPENEMVVYAGGFDKEMYILHSGYCEITEKRKPSESWIAGPFTSFGDFEMIQGVPVSMNVKTLTHARIICIEYSTYLRAVTKYPDVRREIELSMEQKNPKRQISLIEESFKRIDEEIEIGKKLTQRLWSSLKDSVINVHKFDKQHGIDYGKPFEEWKTFRFFKYLILPFVIKPSSLLLLIWMTIRIITVLLIGFLGPVYFSIPSVMNHLSWVILMLQIITWIDIFVSFHIAFYNEKGILIFHPAKTVVHYLKTSFVFDFFLAFPFFWVFQLLLVKPGPPNLINKGPSLLKILQFYKFLQACNHYESNITTRTADIKLLKYLPTVLIFTNILSATVILIECLLISEDSKMPTIEGNSTMSIYRRKIYHHCTAKTDESLKGDIAGDLQMFLLTYYWIISSMTTSGFGDMLPQDHVTIIMTILIVILGVFLFGCMFASIASSKISSHHDVIKYRAKLREMMIFLNKENADEKLKNRFLMHYIYNWDRTLGHMPQIVLSHIHTALQQDIVGLMYEKTLRKISAFSNMETSFMRSIGKYIDKIYFLNGETIVKHNHIQKELYIIYRGKINIFGSDGKLKLSMKDGGIFGSIRQEPYSLSSITAIAATKVELLELNNEDLHKTLSNYPSIKAKIMSLTAQERDFIAPLESNEFTVDDPEDYIRDDFDAFGLGDNTRTNFSYSNAKKGRFYLKRAIFKQVNSSCFAFAILSHSWLHSLIEFSTVIMAYISFILVSYVFAFQDFKQQILIPYLLTDIFFYLKIYLEFHLTYIDKLGDHIYKVKTIRKRYLTSWRFYFDLCANFPLDFFAFIVPRDMLLVTLSFLRLNRLLRLYYIVDYYRRKRNTLVINIFFLEIGLLCTWLSSTIHLFACIWYLLACPIFYCSNNSWLTVRMLRADDKLEIYINCIYFVAAVISTTGYGDIVPVNLMEFITAIFMLITSHFSMVLGSAKFLAMMNVQTLNFDYYEESISMLRRDLNRQKISNYQLKKLWSYVQLLWGRESGKQIPQFINSAPYVMKCDVYNAMFGKHLNNSFIFSDLDPTFLSQLTIYMVRYVFFPKNYIVQQGDNDGTMYFIHRGEVSVMTIHLNLMETIHYNVIDNDQFGIPQGLIFGLAHEFSYRAETEVEILSLTLDHWQHLFKYFPKVKPIIYERLQKIS